MPILLHMPPPSRREDLVERLAWAVRNIQVASADFAVAISDARTVDDALLVFQAAQEMERLLEAQVTAISLKLNQLGAK